MGINPTMSISYSLIGLSPRRTGFGKICGGRKARCGSYLESLDSEGDTISATETQRGNPSSQAALLQGVEEGRENPRAAGADRMSQCDRASVDVHAVGIDPQLAEDGDQLNGERLVDFEEIDITERPANFLQEPPNRLDRCHEELHFGASPLVA